MVTKQVEMNLVGCKVLLGIVFDVNHLEQNTASWKARLSDQLLDADMRALGAGMAQWYSNGIVIKRSRVQVPAGALGECSSSGFTFCADSYFGIRSTPVLPQ